MTTAGSGGSSRVARWLVVCLSIAWLAACGGGDDAAKPPTALPASVVLAVPAVPQALGSPVAFSSNAVDPANALAYRWEFGDGGTATAAAPSHAYARAGNYTVRLTLSNEAGTSVAGTAVVSVADFAIVRGKVCSGTNNGGWCWQRPLPQGNEIADYSFFDDSHGWAVGRSGTLLATVDGGISWSGQVSGTRQNIRQVRFTSTLVGWAAADNGEILKTADGGATWVRSSTGQGEQVFMLGATDASTAWIVTYGGQAYLTVDGGLQWRRVAAPPGSARTIVLSGTDVWSLPYFGSPALAHSVDGGKTYASVAFPGVEPGLTAYYQDLQFADASHALLFGSVSGYPTGSFSYVSRSAIWRTADRGATWQAVSPPSGSFPGTTYQLVDSTTLYAYYPGFDSLLQRSVDGGVTWQPVARPTTSNYLSSFEAFSAQRLLATDSAGVVYLSIDGGSHWNARGAGEANGPSLNSVWFFDARNGIAFGDDGSTVRSSDGGQTWATTTPPGYYGWRRGQFSADGSLGWIISDTGTIYRSSDKGNSWLSPVPQSSALLYGVTDFHFIDSLRGWAVAPYPQAPNGSFFRTTDGGSSWQSIDGTSTLLGFFSIRFADALHGVAVGPPGIAMISADGGSTWSPRPTGGMTNLSRVAFADAATAVAVGDYGSIVRSTDQGRTWTVVASPTLTDLSDIRFLSPTVGHATGSGGTLLVSRDAGMTWIAAYTGAEAGLRSVFFIDEQTGWVAGNGGSILATATGGR